MTEAQRKLWENDGKVLAINEVSYIQLKSFS